MPDVDAGLDAELLEDGEEVERVAFQRGVAREVEVVRVGGPGAHGVEEHDAVVGDEVRHQVLPHGLVRAEAVRQHDHPALPVRAHHPQVVRLLHDPHVRRPGSLVRDDEERRDRGEGEERRAAEQRGGGVWQWERDEWRAF